MSWRNHVVHDEDSWWFWSQKQKESLISGDQELLVVPFLHSLFLFPGWLFLLFFLLHGINDSLSFLSFNTHRDWLFLCPNCKPLEERTGSAPLRSSTHPIRAGRGPRKHDQVVHLSPSQREAFGWVTHLQKERVSLERPSVANELPVKREVNQQMM